MAPSYYSAGFPVIRRGGAKHFGVSSGDWSPGDLSGLQIWLDAADFVGAGPISQWDDKSGNGWHFTQAVGADQPSVVLSAYNGKPTVRFDGVSEHLQNASTGSHVVEFGTAFAVWVVCKLDGTGSTYQELIDLRTKPGDIDLAWRWGVILSLYPTYADYYSGNSYTSPAWGKRRWETGSGVNTSSIQLLENSFAGGDQEDNGNWDAKIDGVTKTLLTSDPFWPVHNKCLLGCMDYGGGPAAFLAGDVCEVIVAPYDARVTPYLMAKWGI